jgi:hypothetical protein
LFPVYGYLVDDSTGQPVPNGVITAVGRGLGALAEADGRYALWLPAGSHVLRAETIGYAADSVLIELDSLAVRSDFALTSYPVSVESRQRR